MLQQVGSPGELYGSSNSLFVRSGVIVGIRPEDFQDADLISDQERQRGITFDTKIDVLESMGSEFYAYFVVESERVASRELDELASDAGAADLPQQESSQLVARLDAASQVKQGQPAKLWFNTDHIHLFDPKSGESLLGERNAGATAAAPSAPSTATGDAPALPPPQ
jgi:multiple sugar transport system ATP-binding protein